MTVLLCVNLLVLFAVFSASFSFFRNSFDRDMLLDAVLLILKSLGSKIGIEIDVDINSGSLISNKTNEWSDLSVLTFPLLFLFLFLLFSISW